MASKERHHHSCRRCGYEWYGIETPKSCTACKSPYWNKKRKRELAEA